LKASQRPFPSGKFNVETFQRRFPLEIYFWKRPNAHFQWNFSFDVIRIEKPTDLRFFSLQRGGSALNELSRNYSKPIRLASGLPQKEKSPFYPNLRLSIGEGNWNAKRSWRRLGGNAPIHRSLPNR